MIRYIIKRILLLIPVIIAVILIVFTLMELAPGSIIDSMISDSMTEADIAALMAQYNLDKPMIYRFGIYMLNLIQGNLGASQVSGLTVWALYSKNLPNTALLAISALIIGSAIGIPLGIFASRHAGTLADNASTVAALIGMSMPGFWLGLVLMLLFSDYLQWFPAGAFNHGIRSLVLPALTSSATVMATTARQTRSSMLEVLKSDYLRTARAKGTPEKMVIRKHALGNALIPIITVMGSSLGVQLAGAIVIESVFTWPGVGRLTIEAVKNRDIPLALGCVIMTSILFVLVNLVVDLLFALFDPRIKSMYIGTKRKRPVKSNVHCGAVSESIKVTAALSQVVYNAGPESIITTNQFSAEVDNKQSVAVRNSDGLPGQTVMPLTTAEAGDSERIETSYIVEREIRKPEAVLKSDSEITSIMKKYRKRSRFGDIFHRVWQNKGATAGLIILCMMILIALATIFMDYDAVLKPNVRVSLSPPSWLYPFGTDRMGRNLFLRVLYGTRYSMIIGFAGVAIASLIGIALGSFAGYYGGKTDDVLMRVSEVISSVPGMLLGMVIMVVLGQSLVNLIIAVGIAGIPSFLRISRASILTVRSQEFVESARAQGFSNIRIIFTQVLPNGLSPIIVTMTTHLGVAILIAASLSYLGFGIPAPTPEWGALITAGRDAARAAPWLMLFPGIFIILVVLAFNLLGDGLRDALDPKLKK